MTPIKKDHKQQVVMRVWRKGKDTFFWGRCILNGAKRLLYFGELHTMLEIETGSAMCKAKMPHLLEMKTGSASLKNCRRISQSIKTREITQPNTSVPRTQKHHFEEKSRPKFIHYRAVDNAKIQKQCTCSKWAKWVEKNLLYIHTWILFGSEKELERYFRS